MTQGRFVVYNATEIIHDDVAAIHDTTSYLLKTIVGNAYTDNEGRVGRELERYKSFDNGISWVFADVWTQFRTGNRAELIEENQKIIKLVFAPTYSKEWDINAFNSASEQNAFYSSIHNPFLENGLSFDSTLTVVQEDFFSLVDLKRQTETYAKNVGLVSKFYKDLIIENFDTLNPTKGQELFYEIVEYGVE